MRAHLRAHDLYPLDDDQFIIDRDLRVHGIADLDDPDGRVRLLALRDLVLAGTVRLAYVGTYWGDRPSMSEVLEMVRSGRFAYDHPERLKPARG